MSRFCSNCGTTLKDDQGFCPNCGAPVPGSGPAANAGPAPAGGVNQPFTPPAPKGGQGLSIAALVLGILGILGVIGGFIPIVCYFTTICAILGIILGAKGRQMSIAATGSASGLATAGLVLGIIGTAFAVLGLICTVCSIAVLSSLG